MMQNNPFRMLFPLFVYAASLLLLFGCGSAPPPVPPAAPSKQEDRGISVVEKMRHNAVSPKVGRWAVVVGISDYKYDTRWDKRRGIPDLQFADRDAKAFARFLMSPQGGAFPPDHVLLLTDRRATVNEVRDTDRQSHKPVPGQCLSRPFRP
jgi:hypothetical protein